MQIPKKTILLLLRNNYEVITVNYEVNGNISVVKRHNSVHKIFYPIFDTLRHVLALTEFGGLPSQVPHLSQHSTTSSHHRGTKVSFTRVYCDWYTFSRFKEIPYESLRVKDSNDDGYAKTTRDTSPDR